MGERLPVGSARRRPKRVGYRLTMPAPYSFACRRTSSVLGMYESICMVTFAPSRYGKISSGDHVHGSEARKSTAWKSCSCFPSSFSLRGSAKWPCMSSQPAGDAMDAVSLAGIAEREARQRRKPREEENEESRSEEHGMSIKMFFLYGRIKGS